MPTVKGAALDARLQHGLLLDPKLRRRLTGDEFRSFICLTVWTVSLVSEGAFDGEDAEMVIDNMAHIDRMLELEILERCEDSGMYRFHPDYWDWQSTKAQLDKIAADRERDRLRKQGARAAKTVTPEDVPPPPDPGDFEAEPPFDDSYWTPAQ